MSVATPSQLKAFYPEFAAVLDATVQLYLDAAAAEMNVSVWPVSSIVYGEMALAAHFMSQNGLGTGGGSAGGGSGPISSISVGSVSVSYANSSSGSSGAGGDSLASTKYGLEYLRRVQNLGLGFFVLGACP